MNTIKEIKDAIQQLEAAMSEKGIKTPTAQLNIESGRDFLFVRADHKDKVFDGDYSKIFYGDDVAYCFSKAFAYIAALPDPEAAAVRAFQRNLADVIDEGNGLNMPNEVMGPLHAGSQALSDNLLTDQREAV